MSAREGRHEGVLDRQRGVRAGEEDRRQICGDQIVEGAAAAQVGVGRLHALAIPIVAISAIAGNLQLLPKGSALNLHSHGGDGYHPGNLGFENLPS